MDTQNSNHGNILTTNLKVLSIMRLLCFVFLLFAIQSLAYYLSAQKTTLRLITLSLCFLSSFLIITPTFIYRKIKKPTSFVGISILTLQACIFILYVFLGSTMLLFWILPICIIGLYLNKRWLKQMISFTIIVFSISSILNAIITSGQINIPLIIANLITYGIELIAIFSILNIIFDRTTKMYTDSLEQNEKLATISEQTYTNSQGICTAIGELCSNIEESNIGIRDLSVSSTEVMNNSEHVAHTALEAKKNVEQMFERIRKTTESSSDVENLTTKVGEITQINMNNIELLENKTKEISTVTEAAKQAFLKLYESTTEISNALNIIDSVASQTNLLSLNASIEAARAGEAGKGFSVVATEIKKLAEQTLESARYINDIVSTININTESSLKTMDATSKIVNENASLLTATQEDFYTMAELQKQTIDKIHYSDRLIKELASEINTVQTIIDGNLTDCRDINESIQNTTATIEELHATFQQITTFADTVNTNAHILLNSQRQLS